MMTKRMFKIACSGALLTLLSALSVLGVAATQTGNISAQGASKCTLKTIQGTYIFEARGVIKDGGKTLPYAEAGVWTLDGAGKAVGTFSASVNGEDIARQKPLTATYELTTGCVFKATDSESLVFDLYPAEQGNVMTYFTSGVSGTMFKR